MDLAQLAALAAVVDEGSFDGAARLLHVTPSAVSQRIKGLEQSAGQVLVRRTKPVGVTPPGEAYLRLARQVEALVHDTVVNTRLGGAHGDPVTVPIAVNADSMATWVLPALATLPPGICFDLHRDDQSRTADLLRSGTVMAAITSVVEPVQGCRSTRLGVMRYQPVAAPGFVERWFAEGVTVDALEDAPMVVFDRNDDLQERYLRRRSRRRIVPPRHHVPASADFAEAVRLGLGWAVLPTAQSLGMVREGRLVELDPGQHVDVLLHWQQWTLVTPALEAVAAAIRAAAADHLL
ncbi:LysR family transcriptional regulator ArgP [Aeromicrobium fastidiosum]|uniref:LysR family transcriptional regulator ArgP n=1 Tax=Aeromicrobium fastidiosum TaxID=52699 RepID=A0A641AKV3_9ACTN|nr:LysR family transcriptional regulator ArgP [Aeromicrobium fastidiosum]KAA1373594.1 LysR family transcriptional regulator ArgP [Aeromicrobium fastidiosum]MBP2391141.1 LysR family transcriptional regulator (chromosome initiation inhibitor) [Aeromicrobium fastidiosum]